MSIHNNSRLRLYEKCPRSYYYGSVRNLFRQSEWGDRDRDEGTLFHAMLAEWYDSKDTNKVQNVLQGWLNTELDKAELDVEQVFARERHEYMWNLFEAYVQRYDKDDSWTVIEIERSGITVLGDECTKCKASYPKALIEGKVIKETCGATGDNLPWPCEAPIHYLVGQADLIVLENQLVKIVDHKTKGGKAPSISESYLAGFDESPQFTQYMYIFGRNLGRPVDMGIANAVAKLKTIAKRGNPFKRNEEIIKSERDYSVFVADRLALIQAIELEMTSLDENNIPKPGTYSFRRNTDACRDFGLCPFFGICHPARDDWWNLPSTVAGDFACKESDYVSDYKKLIEEEVQ